MLSLDAERLKGDELMSGSVFETFVATELAKQASWSGVRPALFHFRTQKQQEVDLVIAAGKLVGVEVKKTASPTSGDFRGLRHLSAQTGKNFLRGIVFYTGSTSVAFGPNLHAVPMSAL